MKVNYFSVRRRLRQTKEETRIGAEKLLRNLESRVEMTVAWTKVTVAEIGGKTVRF